MVHHPSAGPRATAWAAVSGLPARDSLGVLVDDGDSAFLTSVLAGLVERVGTLQPADDLVVWCGVGYWGLEHAGQDRAG